MGRVREEGRGRRHRRRAPNESLQARAVLGLDAYGGIDAEPTGTLPREHVVRVNARVVLQVRPYALRDRENPLACGEARQHVVGEASREIGSCARTDEGSVHHRELVDRDGDSCWMRPHSRQRREPREWQVSCLAVLPEDQQPALQRRHLPW